MKKYRYRFHPPEYAIGETEKFYSDMETKGWRLVKRGQYLSKFTAVPPSGPGTDRGIRSPVPRGAGPARRSRSGCTRTAAGSTWTSMA